MGSKTGETSAFFVTPAPLSNGLNRGHEFPGCGFVTVTLGIGHHTYPEIKSIIFHPAHLIMIGEPSGFGQFFVHNAKKLPAVARLPPNTRVNAPNLVSPSPATRSKSQGDYHVPWISHKCKLIPLT